MSWTFIFCCRIRSSSRSNGPSYIGMFILYGVAILQFSVLSVQFSVSSPQCHSERSEESAFSALLCDLCVLRDLCVNSYFPLLCFRCRPTNLFPLLTPPENRFAYALHRPLRHGPRLLRTDIENFQNALRVVFPFHPTLAHWRDPLDQILGHRRFALDAANACCRAPLAHPLQPPRLLRREQFMPVIHRTHVRISWIRAPLPRRVRHHHLRLRPNVPVAFAQRNRIPITLRHLPPVEPRYPRRLRQHRLRLRKYFLQKSPERTVRVLKLTKI